jgi:Homeodomain-like domain
MPHSIKPDLAIKVQLFAEKVDCDLAINAKNKNCPCCKGPLNFARYLRVLRGAQRNFAADDRVLFHGLCCSSEGCRKRVRPPSIRFAGRSPRSPVFLLLATLLKSGGSERKVRAISKELGVSERTIRRWLRMWTKVENQSIWWRKIAAQYFLHGRSVKTLWSVLCGLHLDAQAAMEFLVKESAQLWQEVKITVGNESCAEFVQSSLNVGPWTNQKPIYMVNRA